jgi:RNA polymerase sigma-32 factor
MKEENMSEKKNVPATIPALGGDASLNRYLSEIRKFPVLKPEQEYMLAKRFQEHGDTKAAEQLVTSHLRLVSKIAMGYRGYGLPVSELISEGNIGLMQGVKKFDPDRGFRLATYAVVDPRVDAGIHSAQLEPCQNRHDCRAEKAVFQLASDEEQPSGI